MAIAALSGWTTEQKHVVVASYLGWTLDAFDFFLMVFVLSDIEKSFSGQAGDVEWAITLTLAMRPIGAFLFGRAADRWGRRPTLMADVLIYSLLEFATGFSPNLTTLLILRALFGIAMGGEWGVGASLTLESIPPHARGFVSGLLQSGYPTGYLLASIVYKLVYPLFEPEFAWRVMFMIGVLPALLTLYIRRSVPESPGWERNTDIAGNTLAVIKSHWRIAIYAIVLMTAFNFFSHGTQDLYPNRFLKGQHLLSSDTVSNISIIANIGAIIGGLTFGTLSERFGRRRTIVTAALLSLLVVPFWAGLIGPDSVVWLAASAFVLQIMVQGAWGVIPAHLNELSPPDARGTFPGFVYQLGNLIASSNARLQVWIALQFGGQYGIALAAVAWGAAIAITVLVAFGIERKGVSFRHVTAPAAAD
jgi:SHS family lactate transporter-like MFS transporter